MSATTAVTNILLVEGWKAGGCGVVVFEWSEMDWGPIKPSAEFQVLRNYGRLDEEGFLLGGIYAIDYHRGLEDFIHGRPYPSRTTRSYQIGVLTAEDFAASSPKDLARFDVVCGKL